MDLKEKGHHGPDLINRDSIALHMHVACHYVAILVRMDLRKTVLLNRVLTYDYSNLVKHLQLVR